MKRLFELAKAHYSELFKQLHAAGIKAVSEKKWSTLQSTAALLDQLDFAVFQVRQQIKHFKQKQPNKAPLFNKFFHRGITSWERLLRPAHRKRQAERIEYFNDPAWWNGCAENIKTLPLRQQTHANKILQSCQKSWALQSAYAHYSTLDILHVYHTIIPVFAQWFDEAKMEWEAKAHTLPPLLKKRYQKYLAWFESALAEEKKRLRLCLHERLAISLKKGYGAWDDVIESLQAELNRIGALPNPPKKTVWLQGYLTPKAFVAIRHIIEQEGSEAEKTALHQLAYYPATFDNAHSFDHYALCILNDFNHHYWLSRKDRMTFKSTLYRYLPRFLQWLFWDEEVHARFFQHPNYQFLLAQENAFLNREVDVSHITIETLFAHPTWQQSLLCLQLIRREMQRMKAWLQHPLAFLFPDIIQQLQAYQQSLQQSAESWMKKPLALLKSVLASHETSELSTEDKLTLESAFADLKILEAQGLLSEKTKQQLAKREQRYQALCQMALTRPQAIASSPIVFAVNATPLCEDLRETLYQAVEAFEATQNTPKKPIVQTLKSQLQTNSPLYDRTLLRVCVLDYLKNADELPRTLKQTLQAILDRPEFSQSALNQSVMNQPLASQPPPQEDLPPLTVPLPQVVVSSAPDPERSVLDEDPWDYPLDHLEKHCETMKQEAAETTLTLAWNRKLCPYLIRCLKHIHTLAHWDDFVSHRQHITLLLDTVAEASGNTLPALHQAIKEMVTIIPTLTAERWSRFKRIHLEIQIGTLEHFLSQTTLRSSETASYVSQREFAFLNPASRVLPADSPPTTLSTNKNFAR